MGTEWITIVLGFVLIYIIYWWTKKNTYYWKEQGVPYVKSLPIIGSMKDVLTLKKTMVQFIHSVYNDFSGEKYCGYNLFTTPVLLIRDIDLINQVLIKDFGYFQDRFYLSDENLELFNSSIANLTGDKWKVLRHRMTPTFTSGKMKAMFNKIKSCSEESVLYLKDKKNQDIDTRDFLFKHIINVIADISIGIKANAFTEEVGKTNLFVNVSRKLFEPSTRIIIAQLLSMSAPNMRNFLKLKIGGKGVDDFFRNLTQDLMKQRQESNDKRDDFFHIMLEERRKELNILTTADEGSIDKQITACKDEEPEDLELLEHLKNINYDKNCKVFSDTVIAAQTLTFVAGGAETTAAVLSFALYELAVNEDVQKRAQEEIANMIKSQGFNYQSVKKMTYLDQILNEVLRLRPPGGTLPRVCTKDYKLPGSNLILNKGSLIMIPVAAIHKDPEYFPDPETFNPDRFENMEAIPKGVFFPFGGGPRICIAMRLAILKMKVFLAAILSHYNIILSEKTRTPLKMDPKSMLQHVKGGLWVRFEPRCQ